MVIGKRDRIRFFLSLTEGPAFGILPPADLIGSVQPIYFCVGIRPPVGNKSNSRNTNSNEEIMRSENRTYFAMFTKL